MCSKETASRLSYLNWGIWSHWIFHPNGNTAILEGLLLFLVSLIPAVLDSANISKYTEVFTTHLRPSVVQGSLIVFFLNIAELSWNAFLGKPVQSIKLQSWCYWGQTNDSLQEILSSCTHKESKLLMDALQFGLLLSSFLSNHTLSGKALYIQDP